MRRKLVINSVVNPLSAFLSCRNGDLLESAEGRKMIEHVCAEAALAFAMRAPLDEVVYTTQLFTFCLATEKHQMVVQLATHCLLGDDAWYRGCVAWSRGVGMDGGDGGDRRALVVEGERGKRRAVAGEGRVDCCLPRRRAR